MFKKPEDISPLPAGMVDAFTKTVNQQLGNYDVAQEAPAPEAPTAEADIPEQQEVEEGVKAEGNAFTKALKAARDNGDDEFIVSGKKYRVEDYDEDEEDEDDEEEDKEELDEDNTNDVSDDGDGLDKVQPKAVKKKFKDRKDKDIDNDGDVDDSDKYLHNRRKAISKALESIDGRTKAFKEKVAKLSYTKEETEELDENRNLLKDYEELKKKGKSDSQAQDVLLSMPQYKRYDSSKLGKVIGDALRKGTIRKKAPFKLAEESGDLGKPEGFFSEEMDPTDHVRFNKETNMFCVYDKDGKKVYESEKEEEANKYAIDNHDALMGRDELAEIIAKRNSKGEIELTKAKFAKIHKDFKTMIKGKPFAMQMDPKTGGTVLYPVKIVKESVELDESKSASGYDLYHKDFSGAMQHAYAFAKKKGFVVDKNDIDDKVALGPKKPSKGKTNSYILKTNKKKNVHIQVANLDNKRYELNMYIESVDLEEKLKFKTTKKIKGKVFGKISGPFPKAKAEVIAARDFRNSPTEVVKDGSGYSIFVPVNESVELDERFGVKNKYKGMPSGDLKRKLSSFESQLADLLVKSRNRQNKRYEPEIKDMETKVSLVKQALGIREDVELEEAPITGIQGKDRKTYALELDKSGRKVMVRTKNQFGDIKTISLKQAAKLFEASDLEKLEEKKIDPADVDDMVATKGDKESAKMNIIVQLRKAADVKGNLDIVFANGKKQKVPANIIKIALDKYNSFRKPATKKKLIDGMTKSYRDMLKTLKTIKEYSEETESKES
jgi:hypothetical protein